MSNFIKRGLRMKKVLYINILISIMALILTACQTNEKDQGMSKVNSIYIFHSSFGLRDTEFKVDLAEKRFYKFTIDYNNPVERDKDLENEGFQVITDLTDEKISSFKKEADKLDFLHWKRSYDNPNILDGHQWGIIIHFNDGGTKEVYGSNEYPKTWDQMSNEFEKLTGVNVL